MITDAIDQGLDDDDHSYLYTTPVFSFVSR